MADLGTDYTGTGVVDDPYIPLTCAGFIWSIAQNGAYVKMTQNIDFSIDETYRSGISTYLTLTCARLYSDSLDPNGNMYGVNGLSVTAYCFFYNNRGSVVIDQIAFRNCIFTIVSNSNSKFYHFTNNTYSLTMNNCIKSFLIKCNNASPIFEGNLNISTYVNNNCSEYYIFSGSFSSGNSYIFTCKRVKCTVQFTGLKIPAASYMYLIGESQSGSPIFSDHSSFFGDVEFYGSGTGTGYIYISGASYSCFAISMSSSSSKTCQITYSNNSGINILDTQKIDSSVVLTTTSTVKHLTTSQMKSQEYLTQIGFLP